MTDTTLRGRIYLHFVVQTFTPFSLALGHTARLLRGVTTMTDSAMHPTFKISASYLGLSSYCTYELPNIYMYTPIHQYANAEGEGPGDLVMYNDVKLNRW